MKKKRQEQDSPVLKDALNQEVLQQLKEKQRELKAEQEKRQEAEEKKKREERRQREKNKSFEELLAESDMDWKKYK
ncbi:YqkE family protein [Bacillus xiapuensis]|uniref:YqkE family protein n=1 Tax=Bacillus xiapuensis TaxID=2014075 RepID=UPI000C23F1B9|nr:YqkE family protein [Bacillus xiapuensis]